MTTLGEEKRVNAFLRLQNPEIIAQLREKFPEIGEKPDARTVFVKLRELRNQLVASRTVSPRALAMMAPVQGRAAWRAPGSRSRRRYCRRGRVQ